MQSILLPKPAGQSAVGQGLAAHKLRSRQEQSELRALLSFVNYETQDRSFTNQAYLVYLLVFFGIMGLLGLTFFAQGGAIFFSLVPGSPPQDLAAIASSLLLIFLGLLQTFMAVSRTPVRFSEEDRYQFCLQPVYRPIIVLRWLPMPWLKAYFLSMPLFILIGLSYAETTLPAGQVTEHVFTYFSDGISMALKALPWQLLFFILAWACGLFALKHRGQRHAWLPGLLFCAALILLGASIFRIRPLTGLGQVFLESLMPGAPVSLTLLSLQAIGIALGLGLLWHLGVGFKPLQAAAESAPEAAIGELNRYGFASAAQDLALRQRLGMARASSLSPGAIGWRAYLAKTWLSIRRSFSLRQAGDLFKLALIGTGVLYAPSFSLRLLALIFWAYDLRSFGLKFLRADLNQIHLLKLTPVSPRGLLLADSLPPYLLNLATTLLASLPMGLLLKNTHIVGLLVLPGMLATIYLVSANLLLRRFQSPPMLNTALAALAAALPLFLAQLELAYAPLVAVLASLALPGLLYLNLPNPRK